jgi:hypothetical protein
MTSKAVLEEEQAYAGRTELLTGAGRRLATLASRARELVSSRSLLVAVLELGLLLVWALWVGRSYLDLDPTVWPIGGDFPLTIQPHYIWPYVRECGSCILWNGLINGGYPAFAESVAAILHPLVIITTLAWGVINGSKITLVLSFFLAGLAQWWIAKALRLGWVPRMWAAAMAVIGGHLAGRMEMGLVAMVLSTASASLVLAPALKLGESGRRKDAVLLGVVLGLALLSGQLYIQVVLVLTVITMALVYGLNEKLQLGPIWQEYRFAGILALLLAGVFLVPFLRFLPNFTKFTDAAFVAGQPLGFIPLNLVINDFGLYRSELLGKLGFPAMYINYIGWLPVLLALVLFRTVERKHVRRLLALLIPIGLIFAFSSSTVLAPLGKYAPALVGNVRFPSLMTGLAVPLVLALAAWGLDRLIKLNWPKISLELAPASVLRTRAIIPILFVLLPLGLKSAYDFNQGLLKTTVEPLEAPEMVELLATDSTQWVAPPIDHHWMPPLLEQGLKVTHIYRPFNLKDREPPAAQIEFFRGSGDASMTGFLANLGPFGFVQKPEVEYAAVKSDTGIVPCKAHATLGTIDVTCETSEVGVLTVYENAWSGWKAYQDGEAVELVDGSWLSVEVPAGTHHFEFRYKPWDVPLGLSLTGAGILLAIWTWLRRPSPRDETGDAP